MRILCVLEKSPLPDKTGSRRRALRLINHLARSHEIQTVVVSDRVSAHEAQLLARLEGTAEFPPTSVLAPTLRPVGTRERASWLVGRSQSFSWQSRDLSGVIAELRLTVGGFSPDVIWVGSALLASAVLPAEVDAPIVIDVAHREREAVDSYLRASVGGIDQLRRTWKQVALTVFDRAARLRREADGLGRASLISVCSERDADGLGDVASGNVAIVRNGVDLPGALGWDPSSHRLLFVGNLGYAPNLDAVRLLVGQILPKVRRSIPDAELHIVGEKPAAIEEFGPSECVFWHGFVDDLAPHYTAAGLVVAPLWSGSGTKLKVLEAFAHGVPVVTTPTGVAGLEVTAGREVAVGHSASDLAQLVVAVLGDPAAAATQRDLARSWVERTHTWESAGDVLRRSIERLAERSHDDPS
jgi:glycosyltransferase involved in cell wall biosynthesis